MNEQRMKIESEINACKSLLKDSDYQIIKLVENMTDCTTIAGLVKLFAEFIAEFGELKKKRREWRATINRLEDELADLPEEIPEPEQEHPDIIVPDELDPEYAVDDGNTDGGIAETPTEESAEDTDTENDSLDAGEE